MNNEVQTLLVGIEAWLPPKVLINLVNAKKISIFPEQDFTISRYFHNFNTTYWA